MLDIRQWSKDDLVREVLHFQELGARGLPRTEEFPDFPTIDYYGTIEPYRGCVGGDHLFFLNFEQYHMAEKIALAELNGQDALARSLRRTRETFGILIADVAGHSIADTLTVNYLHAGFTIGVEYELLLHGHISAALFEKLNTNFFNRITHHGIEYQSSKPFATLIYGELHKHGQFRYLNAGHPSPIVFSQQQNRIVQLGSEVTQRSTPLGVLPSEYDVHDVSFKRQVGTKKRYAVNEITLLGAGDVLLLATDGLFEREHDDGEMQEFTNSQLETVLLESSKGSAQDIHDAVKKAANLFCPANDDVTLVVIKKK